MAAGAAVVGAAVWGWLPPPQASIARSSSRTAAAARAGRQGKAKGPGDGKLLKLTIVPSSGSGVAGAGGLAGWLAARPAPLVVVWRDKVSAPGAGVNKRGEVAGRGGA